MSLRHVTLCLVLLTLAGLTATSGCQNPREGYTPEQPIPFSHYLHAGQNEVECQYCHVSPAAGRHSTVPSVNICMNCHKVVNGRTEEGKQHIVNLRKAYEENRPIEWVKVHDLADFGYFSHQPHIAHGFDCTQCHGEVNTMPIVGTQTEFNMGWCVNCHRENNGPLDCTSCHR